jgi:tRNA-dihydrouridine synthase A
MVDVTDRYFRYLVRLMTKNATLYTEMINENAIIKNSRSLDWLIGFDDSEHPVVCQLGGNDPAKMTEAAVIV